MGWFKKKRDRAAAPECGKPDMPEQGAETTAPQTSSSELAASDPAPVPAVVGPDRKGITADALFDYLKSEGFLPERSESDSSMFDFKYQGMRMSMTLSDDDYVRIVAVFSIDPEDVIRADLLRAAMSVMFELRAVKIVVGDTWIQFSVEAFASSVEELSIFFIRYLDIISGAVAKHGELYRTYEEERDKAGQTDDGSSDSSDEGSLLDKILMGAAESQAGNPTKS